jgi:alkylated DNA nucleotide flippase Atl1
MKYAITFLGGSVFSAGAVVLAGGRPAVMLWLGATLAVTTLGAILWLAGIRRVARFLNAFMDALEGSRQVARPRVISGKNANPWGWVKPSTKQQERNTRETAAEYLDIDPDELLDTPAARRVS